MATFSKLKVLNEIERTGMVPVFYNSNAEIVCNVLKACYNGGVRVFEFTNRGDFAHEVFEKAIKFAEKECPGLILGAGSIVLHSGVRFRFRNRICTRSRLRPMQNISGRKRRWSLFCKKYKGTDALDTAHGYGSRCAKRRKSVGMV